MVLQRWGLPLRELLRMKQKNNKGVKPFLKYTSLALQLGLTIAVFTFLGKYLDERNLMETPWFTVSGALFGVGSGLYLALKDLIKTDE